MIAAIPLRHCALRATTGCLRRNPPSLLRTARRNSAKDDGDDAAGASAARAGPGHTRGVDPRPARGRARRGWTAPDRRHSTLWPSAPTGDRNSTVGAREAGGLRAFPVSSAPTHCMLRMPGARAGVLARPWSRRCSYLLWPLLMPDRRAPKADRSLYRFQEWTGSRCSPIGPMDRATRCIASTPTCHRTSVGAPRSSSSSTGE